MCVAVAVCVVCLSVCLSVCLCCISHQPLVLCRSHPATAGVFEFWALASTDARHFDLSDEIHFKTDHNSHFLKTFFHTKLGNFQGKDGAQVGGDGAQEAFSPTHAHTRWPAPPLPPQVMTEMSRISDQLAAKGKMPQDLAEGCDSDEWSD